MSRAKRDQPQHVQSCQRVEKFRTSPSYTLLRLVLQPDDLIIDAPQFSAFLGQIRKIGKA